MALSFIKSPPSIPSDLSYIGRFFGQSCGSEHVDDHDHDHYNNRTDENKVINIIQENKNQGSLRMSKVQYEAQEPVGLVKLRSKRPARLVVPEFLATAGSHGHDDYLCEKSRKLESKLEEFEVRGRDFVMASKKGRRRESMEDGHGVLLDIMGDPKQAFFAVIDGHGGSAATEYVAENLGKNIAKRLEVLINNNEDHHKLEEEAIREGYLITDKGFLDQGASSGACAASVLVKSGHLHIANVGDCRVVMCRDGVAHTLTNDHRLAREDERLRIENSGGFVHCKNGVWRVHGSLAVSRAIGDQHLKEWVISEPEIKSLPLTSDCEFLIIASDGLWDKVSGQEAVDVIVGESGSEVNKACKKLVDMSSSRGNMDDITVMVINLQKFLATNTCQS